jgi:hypothetical protein
MLIQDSFDFTDTDTDDEDITETELCWTCRQFTTSGNQTRGWDITYKLGTIIFFFICKVNKQRYQNPNLTESNLNQIS